MGKRKKTPVVKIESENGVDVMRFDKTTEYTADSNTTPLAYITGAQPYEIAVSIFNAIIDIVGRMEYVKVDFTKASTAAGSAAPIIPALARSKGLRLKAFRKVGRREIDLDLSKYNLSLGEFEILNTMKQSGNDYYFEWSETENTIMKQGYSNINKSSVKKILDGLVSKGYITEVSGWYGKEIVTGDRDMYRIQIPCSYLDEGYDSPRHKSLKNNRKTFYRIEEEGMIAMAMSYMIPCLHAQAKKAKKKSNESE